MLALVLDDSRAQRRSLCHILTGCGFRAVEAGDGREALDVMAAAPVVPVLALVGCMPGTDGLRFVRAVRAEPAYRSTTHVALASPGERGQILRALAAGAHEHVTTPVSAQAVRQKLDLLGLATAA